jgi:hypothetical protein
LDGILVKNTFSLINAGTERSSVELARKSLLGKAKSQPSSFSHESEQRIGENDNEASDSEL